jgi:CIC family chloride channel protein
MADPAKMTNAESMAHGNLLKLGALALLAGGAAGLVGAVFRLVLQQADHLRDRLIAQAHNANLPGLGLVVAGCAAATAIAAWLVRRFSPQASGSGIPHVESVLRGELPQAPYRLIPVKFLGGLLAIGSGLALGREGPSVQMGASVAHMIGRLFRRPAGDCLALLAGGAGAGLATAFNAPIAGAVFVLEELMRCFDTRIAVVTFGASAGAIAVSRLFLGDLPDFRVAPLPYPPFIAVLSLYLLLGMLAGLIGVAYNRTLLAALTVLGRLRRCPVEARAAGIGAIVGLIAWFGPGLVGGGDALTQQYLSKNVAGSWIAVTFLCRFGLGPLAYAAQTPDGLFAPMLVLGTQIGLLFGDLCGHWLGGFAPDPRATALVGMAAFFTAVVRSPLTGIVLVIELTGNLTLLLPMLSACFAAMLLPTLLRDPPIYDSLAEQTSRSGITPVGSTLTPSEFSR